MATESVPSTPRAGPDRARTRRPWEAPIAATLRFGAADLLRCRFSYSPVFETLSAVRVATGPQPPGPHRRWLAEVRPALAGLDLRPLTLLQPRRGYTPDFLSPPPRDAPEAFDAELARIAATPHARVRQEIDRSLADTPGAARSATGTLLRGDPAEVLDLLTGLVAEAWRTLVAPYWPRLRALLDADIAYRAGRLAEGGLDRLFAELHPSVRFQDDMLVRAHGDDDHRDLAGAGLVLLPSAFKWDQVVVVLDPPWQPTLVYPARGVGSPGQAARDGDLGRLIGRTRALLLTDLAEPAATSWLAHRHRLAPATVSEHLAVLRRTGLVTGERHGYEVRYRRTPLGDALVAGDGLSAGTGRPPPRRTAASRT